MKIAIIGGGNVGTALGRASRAAGHSVVIAAAHPEHASTTASAIGAQAAPSKPKPSTVPNW